MLLAIGLASSSCGSDGSHSVAAPGEPFLLESLTPDSGGLWQLSRPLEIRFSRPIDFDSVSSNTITIVDADGQPALGEFLLPEPTRVLFQPNCPRLDDYSDAGLRPGGITYRIVLHGLDSSGPFLRAEDGQPLTRSEHAELITPQTTSPGLLFHDPVAGPPAPLIRSAGSTTRAASYIEVGGDDQRRYFSFDPQTQSVEIPAGLPLNLASDPRSSVTVVLELNQAISPLTSNLARLRLEFLEENGSWFALPLDAELTRNCSSSGTQVRLTPQAILPKDREVRVRILAGFQDLAGSATMLDWEDFAHFRTTDIGDPSFVPAEDFADELVFSFDDPSRLDTEEFFAEPRALWNDGRLTARTAFEGTGGPGGNFDLMIPSGTTLVIDTTSTVVLGGPGYLPLVEQTVVGGNLDVRNLWIQFGAFLRVQGPNPLSIRATGEVRIEGFIDACGFAARDVSAIGEAEIPELGAAGAGGGGQGGTASLLMTASTDRGEPGFEAFAAIGSGSDGGEAGYGGEAIDQSLPGGGAGGVFARNQTGLSPGLVAEDGENGSPRSFGAQTGAARPLGGTLAPGPFRDDDIHNDFFGFARVRGELVRGELASLSAGAGGGAGGDAIQQPAFPNPVFPFGDKKGAGGGGGAGCILVQALGNIVFGPNGRIRADGGDGAIGEQHAQGSPIGGGSGGGSGGHVVLESQSRIDCRYLGSNAISALGGRGGAGNTRFGRYSAGGNGGPGVIQLHVPEESALIRPQSGSSMNSRTIPNPHIGLPSFSPLSRARSVWIPLGEIEATDFLFRGTDPASGYVVADEDGTVEPVPALMGPLPLRGFPQLPYVSGDTLVLDASELQGTRNDLYLRNPYLLRTSRLRSTGAIEAEYIVAHASYDTEQGTLHLTVDSEGASLPQDGEAVSFELVPRSFEVLSGDEPDRLPAQGSIRLLFQGAPADGLEPATSQATAWTADPSTLGNHSVDFIRFEVLFDVGTALHGSPETPKPALDSLRIPFRF